MIYRVECRKDGSIASCVEVESQHKDGGSVVYIEADNRTQAIALAKKKWERLSTHKKSRTEKLITLQMCQGCGVVPRRANRVYCLQCTKKRSSSDRSLRGLRATNDAAGIAKRAEEIRLAQRRHMLEIAERARPAAIAASRAAADARWDTSKPVQRKETLSALRQVLRAYDRDPGRFRVWLLHKIGSQEASSAEAAE